MREINWGMIGCGDVTERKSAPAFNKIDGSRLVAVMSRTAERVKDYAQRHGVPRWYTDANELVQDNEVNAIYIATPPDSHAHYTGLAAAAGKPVYVEKPMACTYDECCEMVAACERAGVPIFVAYYRRSLPNFVAIKEAVEQGRIGNVRLVRIELTRPPKPEERDPDALPWRVLPQIAGGGYFVDLASHQLDYLDHVFGPISSVSGYATNLAGLYPAEDTVSAAFQFKNGTIGSGVWCFATSDVGKRDAIEITGDEGRITLSAFDLAQPAEVATLDGTETIDLGTPEPVQLPLIQSVVAALRGEGKCPSSGASAARTAWVIDQVLARK